MSELNIYQRMHNVMKAVSYIQKGEKTVNGQYRFVSHDAVAATIRPALLENGILTVVSIDHHKQDGTRTEVDLVVQFVNIDKPDDRIVVRAFGYGLDPQDKGPGKAVSYAFKYALLKTFCLETGDDSDSSAQKTRSSSKTVSKDTFDKMTPEEQQFLKDHAMEALAIIDSDGHKVAFEYIKKQKFDADEYAAIWHLFNSKDRTAFKEVGKQLNGA